MAADRVPVASGWLRLERAPVAQRVGSSERNIHGVESVARMAAVA